MGSRSCPRLSADSAAAGRSNRVLSTSGRSAVHLRLHRVAVSTLETGRNADRPAPSGAFRNIAAHTDSPDFPFVFIARSSPSSWVCRIDAESRLQRSDFAHRVWTALPTRSSSPRSASRAAGAAGRIWPDKACSASQIDPGARHIATDDVIPKRRARSTEGVCLETEQSADAVRAAISRQMVSVRSPRSALMDRRDGP